MIHRVNSCLLLSPSPPAIFITSLQLSTYLVGNTSLTKKSPLTHPPYNTQSAGYLQDMGKQVKESTCIQLPSPFYSPPYHWAVISINILLCTIHCGDSIGQNCPKVLVTALATWLRHHFGGRPFTFSNNLWCARQDDDSVSCGIIAINTVKHHAFGEPLWSKTNWELLRIEEFNSILGDFVDSFDPETVPPNTPASTFPTASASESTMLSPPTSPSLSKPSDVALLISPVHLQDSKSTRSATPPAASSSTTPSPLASPLLSKLSDIGLLISIVHLCDNKSTQASSLTASPSTMPSPLASPSPPTILDPVLPPSKQVGTKKSRTLTKSMDFGPVGISCSAVAAKVLMAKVAAGTHIIDKEKWDQYVEKILAMDPDAEVELDEPLLICHSVCRKDFKQWPLYDMGNFKKHLEKCRRSTQPAGGTHTLSFLFKSLSH
ncbi:hypothetical protein JAAARDRAFT_187382 [Jaapia argillacea MUCL 33604]|uniref:Ubiquitin-like protease family profile domain-containing protein n=1 Tax=Jaapia argillacea MUCL 33604 TaxID=933084 RepID=A0A067QKH1_9AGAM|nr:hypothetical protein JAAARDRAFT_187382 [Jaapia argillacea MUCL 33604]